VPASIPPLQMPMTQHSECTVNAQPLGAQTIVGRNHCISKAFLDPTSRRKVARRAGSLAAPKQHILWCRAHKCPHSVVPSNIHAAKPAQPNPLANGKTDTFTYARCSDTLQTHSP
jgi:hypothetical protein